MPDNTGKLSQEERSEAISRLNSFDAKRGGDLECEVCGNKQWYLSEYLVQAPADTPHGVMGSRMRTPMVMIYCSDCGNSKLFAAKILGINPLVVEDGHRKEGVDGG